ncbi:MAG: hypothetical protein FJ110_12370 [Deltaproteobacteria bacterium]|nr:hypothetical protein [Deltaproteobacteria bacterium]
MGVAVEIRVKEIRLLQGHKSTRAFVDLEIGGITVRDFRVCQTNGKPSVRNPFTSYKDREGILGFKEIISFPVTVQTEINARILNDYFHRVKESRNVKHS